MTTEKTKREITQALKSEAAQGENAVITVIGKDRVGIIASVCSVLAGCNVNVLNISQTIMHSYFTMVMIVDISQAATDFETLAKELEACGVTLGMQVKIQHEDIFNSMHRL